MPALLSRAVLAWSMGLNAGSTPDADTTLIVPTVKPANPIVLPRVIVIMGVAASGKTTAAKALAEALGWSFLEGDDYHPAANRAKMHAGHPLTDDDRRPWLSALHDVIADVVRRDGHAVVACSALKASYRDALVPSDAPAGTLRFVFLDVPRATLEARLRSRQHFFPASLLDSQLATLEEPRDAVRVDGTKPVADIVASIRDALGV
jgi:gluconokinase